MKRRGVLKPKNCHQPPAKPEVDDLRGDHITDRHGPFAQPDEPVFDDPGITEFGKAHETVQRRMSDLHRNLTAGAPL
jgi:hypothetical protein